MLILSSIPPVAGPLIQHCIILSEPEARTHYSLRGVGSARRGLYEPEATIPLFSPSRRIYEPEAIIPIARPCR
jgi:hypothetical protein